MENSKRINANKVAKQVRDVIDNYWVAKISAAEAKTQLNSIMNNPELRIKIKRGNNYTGVFENIMGKRRIEEFEALI